MNVPARSKFCAEAVEVGYYRGVCIEDAFDIYSSLIRKMCT